MTDSDVRTARPAVVSVVETSPKRPGGQPDAKSVLRDMGAGRTWCGRDATLRWAEHARQLLAAKASRAERPGPGGAETDDPGGPEDHEPIVSARNSGQPVTRPAGIIPDGATDPNGQEPTERGDAELF